MERLKQNKMTINDIDKLVKLNRSKEPEVIIIFNSRLKKEAEKFIKSFSDSSVTAKYGFFNRKHETDMVGLVRGNCSFFIGSDDDFEQLLINKDNI